jgi:hypothetical protein
MGGEPHVRDPHRWSCSPHAPPRCHRTSTHPKRPFDLRDWSRIAAVALPAVGVGTLVASPPVVLAIVFVIAMTRRGQRLLFGARLTNHAPRHRDRVSGGRPASAADARPPLSRR